MSKLAMLTKNVATKIVFEVAGLAALVVALAVGLMNVPAIQAQSSAVPAPVPAARDFEVASIRPSTGRGAPDKLTLNLLKAVAHGSRGGRFMMKGAPVTLLIELAYNVENSLVVGGPSWMSSDRYDVNAKAEGDATFDQMRPMLQSLLADRFKLAFHRETREIAVYQLGVAKGGLKIVPEKNGSCITFDPSSTPPPFNPNSPPKICGNVRRQIVNAPDRRERIVALGISMQKLTETLSTEVDRIVVDKTGFTGKFDLHLEFASKGLAPNGDPDRLAPSADSSAPSIFTALQEQLGLKLESARGPAEVLVIDHVERPSEN